MSVRPSSFCLPVALLNFESVEIVTGRIPGQTEVPDLGTPGTDLEIADEVFDRRPVPLDHHADRSVRLISDQSRQMVSFGMPCDKITISDPLDQPFNNYISPNLHIQ